MKFVKRPIEITAVRLTEKTEIETREGTLYGYPGDWLITGVEGEIYPCDHEIFKKTYMPVGLTKCKYCKMYGCMDTPDADCPFEWQDDK